MSKFFGSNKSITKNQSKNQNQKPKKISLVSLKIMNRVGAKEWSWLDNTFGGQPWEDVWGSFCSVCDCGRNWKGVEEKSGKNWAQVGGLGKQNNNWLPKQNFLFSSLYIFIIIITYIITLQLFTCLKRSPMSQSLV